MEPPVSPIVITVQVIVKNITRLLSVFVLIIGFDQFVCADAPLPDIDFASTFDDFEADPLEIVVPQVAPPDDFLFWIERTEPPAPDEHNAPLQFQRRLTVDNADAGYVTVDGSWKASVLLPGYYEADYLQNATSKEGVASVTFTPILPAEGLYEVFMRWPAGDELSNRVPVDIHHRGGMTTVYIDQQQDGDRWFSLGKFDFPAGASGNVVIRNEVAAGIVVADAVRFRRDDTHLTALLAAGATPQLQAKQHGHPPTLRPTGTRYRHGYGYHHDSYAGYGWAGGYGHYGAGYHRFFAGHGFGGRGGGGRSSGTARRSRSSFGGTPSNPDCDRPGVLPGDCGTGGTDDEDETTRGPDDLLTTSHLDAQLMDLLPAISDASESLLSTAIGETTESLLASPGELVLQPSLARPRYMASVDLHLTAGGPLNALSHSGAHVIPEPSTSILLGLGLLILATRRHLRQRG